MYCHSNIRRIYVPYIGILCTAIQIYVVSTYPILVFYVLPFKYTSYLRTLYWYSMYCHSNIRRIYVPYIGILCTAIQIYVVSTYPILVFYVLPFKYTSCPRTLYWYSTYCHSNIRRIHVPYIGILRTAIQIYVVSTYPILVF